ncbi:MAG: cyclic nucleotide-binding domain-containing protein [Pseudomonadota bacterium]
MTPTVTETLLQCELFGKLTAEEIQPIAMLCQQEHYEAGEAIYVQGNRGNKIYIIEDGQVTLERLVDLGERKAAVKIATLSRGRAFGCWSAVLGESRNFMSSAVGNRKTQVVSIECAALRTALQNNLPAGFKVMERLAFMLGDRLHNVFGALEKL